MSNGKTVEFFFDVGSPTAYLAYTQLPALAAACGAQIAWRPMLLGAAFSLGSERPFPVFSLSVSDVSVSAVSTSDFFRPDFFVPARFRSRFLPTSLSVS